MDKNGADNLNRGNRFKRYTHQVRVFDTLIYRRLILRRGSGIASFNRIW